MSKVHPARNSPPPRPPLWPWLVMGAGAVVMALAGFLILRANATRQVSPASQSPSTSAASGAPQLSVDTTVIDFGKVPLNKPVKATFKIKNVGGRSLTILGEPRVELVEGC